MFLDELTCFFCGRPWPDEMCPNCQRTISKAIAAEGVARRAQLLALEYQCELVEMGYSKEEALAMAQRMVTTGDTAD